MKRELPRESSSENQKHFFCNILPTMVYIQSSLVGHFWDHLVGYYFATERCHFDIINIPALNHTTTFQLWGWSRESISLYLPFLQAIYYCPSKKTFHWGQHIPQIWIQYDYAFFLLSVSPRFKMNQNALLYTKLLIKLWKSLYQELWMLKV